MDEQILKDLIATTQANNYNWDTVLKKFPELQSYNPQLLKDYVATAEADNYNYNVINKKFPEFFGEKAASDIEKKNLVDGTSPMEPMGSTLPQAEADTLSESEELVETEADVANPFEGMSLFKEDEEREASKKFGIGVETFKESLARIPLFLAEQAVTVFADDEELAYLNSLPVDEREKIISGAFSGLGKVTGSGFAVTTEATEFSNEARKRREEIESTLKQYETSIGEDFANLDVRQATNRVFNELVGTTPQLVQAMVPIFGLASLGLGSAAQKSGELQREGEDLGLRTSANAIVSGTAEAVFELVTRRLGNKLLKAFKVNPDEAIQSFGNSLKETFIDANLEGGSELATTITQNLSDALIQGKDVDVNNVIREAIDAYIIGSAMGGTLTGSAKAVRTTKQVAEKNRLANQIKDTKYNTIEEVFEPGPKFPEGDLGVPQTEVDAETLSVVSNPASKKFLAEGLRRQVQKGEITQEDASARLRDFDRIKKSNERVNQDTPEDLRPQIVEKLREQEILSEEIEGLNQLEATIGQPQKEKIQEKKDRIEQINQEINAVQEQETGEVPDAEQAEGVQEVGTEVRESDVETEESVPSQTPLKVASDAKSALDNNKPKQELSVDENGNTVVNEVEFFNEDANLELDRLSLLAEKGRLTVDEFQRSYFGQSTDNVTFSEVKKEIQSNPVDFINSLKNSFNELNASQPDVETEGEVEIKAEDKKYAEDLKETKKSNPEAYWSVDTVTEEDASKGTVIDTEDGAAVVGADGDIKGVFKKLKSKAKGVAQTLLKKAVESGGTKLDNFVTGANGVKLQEIYEKAGFRVVSRTPFNEEFAPEGWTPKDGKPDVVAMVYDPNKELDIDEKMFPDPENGYDQMIAYRDSVLDKSNKTVTKDQDGVSKLRKMFKSPSQRKQVENAEKALKAIAPEVNIVVHESEQAYAEATNEQNRAQKTSGEYNPKTKTIHINPDKANARTVAHETFHAILLNIVNTDAEAQRLTEAMMKSVAKVASPELKAYLDAFASNYDQNIRSEEKLAELIGYLAAEYDSLPKPTKNIIKRWLDRLAKMFGLKPFTDSEVIDVLNTIAKKVSTGEVISGVDISVLDRTSNSEYVSEDEKKLWGAAPERKQKRTKPDPKKTVKAYKMFRINESKPGKLFPLFVNANDEVLMNTWLDAEVGELTKDGKVKSKIGNLAYRPGWHMGDLPIATHIGDKYNFEKGEVDKSLKKPTARSANHVWAEVEVAADVDWQKEANSRAKKTKDGKIIPRTAHITDRLPEDGYYRYKTNPNMTGEWLIGGSIKITKILTDQEVIDINNAAGVADLPRVKELDLKSIGFDRDTDQDVAILDKNKSKKEIIKSRKQNFSKASSVEMFENPDILQPKREANGRTKVIELGRAFDKRAKDNGYYIPIPKNGVYTDSQLNQIAEAMTDDAEFQLLQDDSGIGWYDLKTRSAMELMSRIHPELSDSNSKPYLEFTLMVALISQNNSVGINFRQANEAYTYYKNNNKLPNKPYAGKSGNIIKQNIALAFEAIKKKGWEKYKNTLQETKTVKEWEAEGYKINGENKTTKITGAMVMLGSKIGSFWGNLNGDFNTLTADLWFSRMFNRYTGNVVAKKASEKSKQTTLDELKKYKGKTLLNGYKKSDILKGGEVFDKWLNTIVKDYADGGYKDKQRLNIVSNTHFKNTKGELQDIPRGGKERNTMRNVVKRVQDKLIERGQPKLDIADIQAIVWYNEKDLYRQYKAVNKSSEKTDYETAAQEVLREQGVNAEVALPFKTSKSSADGGRNQTDRIQPKSLSEKVDDATRSRKQATGRPSIEEVKRYAKDNNISDKNVATFLKEVGYSDAEINKSTVETPRTRKDSSTKKLTEETLTGYDKMMNRIDDIIQRMSKKPDMTNDKILDSVTKNLQSRDPAYRRATDVQREQIIRDLRSRLGVKEKAAPSAKRVTGQPARKKVTVDEYASLKSQIRLEAKAAREAVTSYKNAGKKIAEAVKALGGKGKITLRQANTVAKKILRTNFTNTKQVDALLDYVQKIYERAELAEMVSNAKGRIKQAKKNLASKVGTNTALKSAVQDLLSLDPTDVPLNLLPQYVALVQSFGERKAVLNLPEQGVVMQTANAILDGVQKSFDLTTKERVEDADYDLDQAVKEIREDKIDTENILNPDVKKLAEKLNSLTKKDIEGLVTENKDGVKNYAKVENLKSVKREMSKGYAPKLANDLAVEIESQRSYDSLENEGAIDRVQKRGIMAIGRTIASIKSIITRRGITQEQLRSIPFIGTSLDNVLGNLNQTQFREKIIDPVANAFSMMTDKMQDVRNEYLQTAEYLLSNDGFVKRSRNAILKSKYKVQLYLLEKENLSNLGSNQVAPAIEFLNETIKYLSKDTSARRNMNKEILEELREEFAPNDGPLDFEKLENSLSKNEIQAATLINQAYNETSSMYEFVSSVVRGEGLKPLNNYVHHSVLKDLNEQKKDNDLTVERITKPSTKSKTIIERTPGAKAINFDPISSADRGVKMMLTDYYMTNPIREVRSLINKLKDTPDLTQFQKDAFEDLDKVFEESIEIVFGKSLESITGVNNFFNAVEELGYYAALASVPRAAAELGSNFAGAVIMNPRTFSLGVTNFSKISFDSTSVAKFAAAIGSKSRSKLAPKGIGGKIQQELTNYNVTSRNKGALNPILDKANFIAKNTTGRIGTATADLAQKLLSTPDMAISRPMYFQTFVNEFQKITGEKLTNDDLQAIADGDTKILEKYPDAVSKARDVADTAIERLSGTTNPLKQPLKYQLKVGDDAFTKVYKKANKYMASFYSVENNTATEGTIALFYSGEITRRQATSLLAMITTRMTVYMAMYAFLQNVFDQLISNALGFRQEDEEDEDYTLLTSRQLVGSISTLILRRSLGSVSSIPVMYGIEKVNEEYLGALRGGNEYDKFKNGIVYVPIRENKSPIEQGVSMLSGAKGPALNTISRLATVISGITGSDKKETRDQYTDELLNRMSIEVLGNVGLLPFYKDIRRMVIEDTFSEREYQKVMKKLQKEIEKEEQKYYREQKKKSKGFGSKRFGSKGFQ